MLRVKAEYNVFTRELRNARLLEFATTVDEEALARLKRHGWMICEMEVLCE